MTNERLFIGAYPCGLVYADRKREEHGDYKRLAFLPYATLALKVEKDCPEALEAAVREHAARFQARRGQRFQIAGNMHVILGQE